jgi:hypothetical protein
LLRELLELLFGKRQASQLCNVSDIIKRQLLLGHGAVVSDGVKSLNHQPILDFGFRIGDLTLKSTIRDPKSTASKRPQRLIKSRLTAVRTGVSCHRTDFDTPRGRGYKNDRPRMVVRRPRMGWITPRSNLQKSQGFGVGLTEDQLISMPSAVAAEPGIDLASVLVRPAKESHR